MRFAHIADCHIGSWRDPKLRDTAVKAFSKAIDLCMEKNIDFIVIAGDLFNTSLPSIDNLKQTVKKLKQLKDKNIPVYVIAGSHDFSPSGKTMLDVLEKAGLITNVAKADIEQEKLKLKFTIDKKTGAKITGLLGKKGGLEKEYYQSLSKEKLEQESGYKIFLFHSLLSELKPKELEKVNSQPLSLLPKNFNYYAGGHPHFVFQKQEDGYGLITYPGPLFPTNFKELEDLERGGLYIVDVEKQKAETSIAEDINAKQEGGGRDTQTKTTSALGQPENTSTYSENTSRIDGSNQPPEQNQSKQYKTSVEYQPIQIHNIFKINIDADQKAPEQIEEEIKLQIRDKEFNNTIVTIRIQGTLSSGRPSDINFKDIFTLLYSKSAYFVMKNTNKLTTKEFKEIKVEKNSVEEIEYSLIKEHLGQIKMTCLNPEKEENLIKDLMYALSTEKQEGETAAGFENRIKEELNKILEL